MNQNRSRKTLIGVLLFGGLLLATPLLWKAWTSGHELNGKVAVFDAPSQRPVGDLLGCLAHRPEGGLKLTIMAENHFTDPARGVVVRIEPQGQAHAIKAWISEGATLTAGETAQLKSCAAG
ncbi:MAG: hypothetical protein ACKOPM_03125 [Novosphingobium sp.]